jgi:hypothetical protein
MKLDWPFFTLLDEQDRSIGYSCLQGPVRSAEEAKQLNTLSAKSKFICFTSYMDFPAHQHPGDIYDYHELCQAWCHCFRQPDDFLSREKPRLLLSYSDFTDYSFVRPEYLFKGEVERKEYDFVYVCQEGKWKEYVKNWDLARRCLPVLCHELGLRGVLVGRENIADLQGYGNSLVCFGELPWKELMKVFWRSRFLFVPNQQDASPRIITEALCLNIPVMVNYTILGGWKYVNPFTGVFFEDERNVAQGALYCLNKINASPRRWFIANSGPINAGRRLAEFIRSFDSTKPALSFVKISNWLYES